MKRFAVLLCAIAAAQAYDAAVQPTASGRTLAAPGENPWLVHLRLAVSTSGLLKTCAGVLIDNGWVLSSASCLDSSRFIWVRYGTVTVINPALVTENSAVILHPGFDARTGENDIALIRINRHVQSTENISPIAIAHSPGALPATGKFCGFGADEQGGPGEQLSCFEVLLQTNGDHIVANSVDGLQSTDYDLGAPLVSDDGVLLGIRNNWFPGLSAGVFVSPANYIDWISSETGVNF